MVSTIIRLALSMPPASSFLVTPSTFPIAQQTQTQQVTSIALAPPLSNLASHPHTRSAGQLQPNPHRIETFAEIPPPVTTIRDDVERALQSLYRPVCYFVPKVDISVALQLKLGYEMGVYIACKSRVDG